MVGQTLITLRPLQRDEIPVVAQVARRIWREHFIPLVGEAQVEYMLRTRYDEADLGPDIGAPDRWFEVLQRGDTILGFLRCRLLSGDTLQIREIYLVPEARGQGLAGRFVEVDVLAGGHTLCRRGKELFDIRFDRDGLKPRRIEELLFRQPRHARRRWP